MCAFIPAPLPQNISKQVGRSQRLLSTDRTISIISICRAPTHAHTHTHGHQDTVGMYSCKNSNYNTYKSCYLFNERERGRGDEGGGGESIVGIKLETV